MNKISYKIKHLLRNAQLPIEFNLKTYELLVNKINRFHQDIKKNSDSQLSTRVNQLPLHLDPAESENIFVPLFAFLKEICIRRLGIVPTDSQILGGIGLHEGKLIEMQTGEGKTLVAVFAACSEALTHGNVHILTFNDYLAKRDAEWMQPIYKSIGLSVGYISECMSIDQKNLAYQCNITYGTAKEVGFDYLRSISAYNTKEKVILSFTSAIVDEADAILIDEARNPLVLAGNLIQAKIDLKEISTFTSSLSCNKDYKTDEYSRNIYLTQQGIEKVEKHYALTNLYSEVNLELHSAINLSLQAKALLKNGVDYIIKDNQIKLVDEFTGRIVGDRKWKNGLQAAVEAKEGMPINSEGSILNSITIQHLVQKYSKICGMTATAQSASEEFHSFYNLKTIVIPPYRKSCRIDHPDLIFSTKAEKYEAIINEVGIVHKTGRPILIGTLSVRESEELSNALNQFGIKCQVLNAKNDEEEAGLISKAGLINSVTISTNMAGRGTDIILGGENQMLKKEIEKLGGLYVIGTNRHESLRIDQQLRGRAGRQGDPGSSRFFVSLEDDLMIKYNLKDVMPEIQPKNYTPANDIAHIQRVVEGQMFDQRRFLYSYTCIIEKQRIIITNERDKILQNSDVENILRTGILIEYDRHWAQHLDYLNEIKEGSHFLRIGGLDPLREFQKKADESFHEMYFKLDKRIQFLRKYYSSNPLSDLSILGINKPSSTWTYIVNDFPFGNALGIMLSQNSNIGFQVDFISVILLFVFRLFKRNEKQVLTRVKSDSASREFLLP